MVAPSWIQVWLMMSSYEIAFSFKQFTRFVSSMTAVPLHLCSSSNKRLYLYNSPLILMHSWRTFFLSCHSLYSMLAEVRHLLIFSEYGVIPTNWNSNFLGIFRLQNHLCLSFPDVLGHLLCMSSFQWFLICAWICDVADIWIWLLFSILSIRYYQSFQHWFSHRVVCLIIVVVHFLNHT